MLPYDKERVNELDRSIKEKRTELKTVREFLTVIHDYDDEINGLQNVLDDYNSWVTGKGKKKDFPSIVRLFNSISAILENYEYAYEMMIDDLNNLREEYGHGH